MITNITGACMCVCVSARTLYFLFVNYKTTFPLYDSIEFLMTTLLYTKHCFDDNTKAVI